MLLLLLACSSPEAPSASADTSADSTAPDTSDSAAPADTADSAAVADACWVDVTSADLVVVLTWSEPGDLDLHLANAPASTFSDPEDCSFCNASPDWGVPAEPADDPVLVIDAVGGPGCEAISIEAPVDGDYYLAVHYFEDNGGTTGTALVETYVSGVLVSSETQLLNRNELWEVGTVSWPAGTVTVSGTAPATATARQCE